MRYVAFLLCACAFASALEIDEPELSAAEFWAPAWPRSRRELSVEPVITNATTAKTTLVAAAAVAANSTVAPPTPAADANRSSSSEAPTKKIDLTRPGVLKRGLLVFGGFGLLALAYFVIYKKRRNSGDGDGGSKPSDALQFRYGVLQTEERSDRLELSRMPLTMDTDEDDEEDLQIFDIGQKDAYLPRNNDHREAVRDILDTNSRSRDGEQLLLDIEDSPAVIQLSSAKGSDVI